MEPQRLESNINISEILRVWHHVAPKWERPHFAKRHCQGLLLFLSGHIECGLVSQYYFSNCFKNHVKMSPSQYREHNPNSSAI